MRDKVKFRIGSVYELDYPDDYFDFVIGQAILHHVSEKSKLVEPLYRILKPGGKAVFFEAFGESVVLEKTRLLIPVRVNEDEK